HHYRVGRHRFHTGRAGGGAIAGCRRSADHHLGQFCLAGTGWHGAVSAGVVCIAQRPVRRGRETRMKTGIIALLVLALAYIAVPLLLGQNNYVMSLIIASLIIGGIALAWALLGNLGGMVSFGHSAFFGVGAYVSALLTIEAGVP